MLIVQRPPPRCMIVCPPSQIRRLLQRQWEALFWFAGFLLLGSLHGFHSLRHFKSSLSTADLSTADLSSLCLLTASDFFIATSNDMKDDSAAWPARPLLPLLLVSVHHHQPLRLLSGDAVVFSLRLNQADQGQKPSGCLCLRLLISHHQQRQEM
jgi:hypothetical protein